MTKEEFREQVSSWSEMFAWCQENGFEDIVENWIWGGDLNEFVEEDLKYNIEEILRNEWWYQVADRLSCLDRHYDVYYRNGFADYEPIDEVCCFDDEYSELVMVLEESGFFDEEEDDELYEEESDVEKEAVLALYG